MATKSESDKNEERRKRVFVGKLPPDFLRISNTSFQNSQEQQEAADAQAAFALQHQLGLPYSNNRAGRLSITVAQAALVKNYGMTKMNPYVILRVGHFVYETPADVGGGKNPKWERVVHCLLPQGVNSIHLKIYDECSFRVDELIAWTEITIPQNVMNGETCDEWFPLSGKKGSEGVINLVISFTPGSYGMYPLTSVVMGIPSTPYSYGNTRPIPVTVSPTPYPVNQVRTFQFSAEDLKQVQEMFPNMDKDVVKSVYEANGGNKDLTINSLLQMSA